MIIKHPTLSDLNNIDAIYDSLDKEDKDLFNPGFLGRGLSSHVLDKFLLRICIFPPLRFLLSVLGLPYFISLVAKEENQIYGFAYIKVGKKSLNDSKKGSLGIFVLKKYRNKGIGKILLKYLIQQASKEKLDKIYLNVFEENKAAYHLYKKVGFIEKEKEVWIVNGKKMVNIVMEFHLSSIKSHPR